MQKKIHEVISYFEYILALFLVVGLGYIYYTLDGPNGFSAPQTLDRIRTLFLDLVPNILATLICFVVIYIFINRKFEKEFDTATGENPPEIYKNASAHETASFMREFINRSSSAVVIVSNDLTWLGEESAKDVVAILNEKKAFVEILTRQKIAVELRPKLKGVRLFQFTSEQPPNARFTLINENRPQSSSLAIARGAHPRHEILVYDSISGPHLLALASDLVCRLRKGAIQYE